MVFRDRPCVSVVLLCHEAIPLLRDAIASCLRQPECLEVLIVAVGSMVGRLEELAEMARADRRLRLMRGGILGPDDEPSHALRSARGSLIGWLPSNKVYTPGALARAVTALASHPDWLMVYGEGEEFYAGTGMYQRYSTLPPPPDIQCFRSHSFIGQTTVVFRRSTAVLLGLINSQFQTPFDFDLWLRAFGAFPHRIGYLPHLQGRTRLQGWTNSIKLRSQLALEGIALIARQFGPASATMLHNYALDFQLDFGALPESTHVQEHLAELVSQAGPWLEPEALMEFRQQWLLVPETAQALLAAEQQAAALELSQLMPVRLLQALHPKLLLDEPGLPAGPHLRLHRAAQQYSSTYPLLHTVVVTSSGAAHFRSSAHGEIALFAERPFGVNLIGHAFEVFGIGEDIRMAARALQAAGVPCCVINYPAANGSTCSDRSLEPLHCHDPAGGPYALNLICMAAPVQARWLLQAGLDPLRERYTLTAWPWETRQWPKAWLALLEVADELWPSSAFTAAALQEPAAAASMHLQVMPMAAEVPEPDRFCSPSARQAARARHGLPQEAVLFGYGFDLNSTAIRKNPMGALEAFQLAFPLPHLPATFGREINNHPLSNQVALMIKSFPPRSESAEWHWLQLRAAEDSRIHLVAANLERDELLALYGCCDVFLSMHRSEGFGRGMAEALQLGVDVIATDYGGNTDFCTGPLAHPVRCQEVPIPRGAYPCADGHVWGEPDLDHASELMQQVTARRLALANDHEAAAADPSRDPSVLATYRQRFSLAAAGARYRARLEELWGQRQELAGRLKWRADTPV